MIKVIIERRIHVNAEEEFKNLLGDMRIACIRQDGYYSGETLRSVGDLSLWIVISSWSDISKWEAWQSSLARQGILSKINPLLVEPAKESIFESAF